MLKAQGLLRCCSQDICHIVCVCVWLSPSAVYLKLSQHPCIWGLEVWLGWSGFFPWWLSHVAVGRRPRCLTMWIFLIGLLEYPHNMAADFPQTEWSEIDYKGSCPLQSSLKSYTTTFATFCSLEASLYISGLHTRELGPPLDGKSIFLR